MPVWNKSYSRDVASERREKELNTMTAPEGEGGERRRIKDRLVQWGFAEIF